jgi:antitoxin ParD1/3/4
MRTNIVIDDQLMAAAMQAGDFKTKKDAVEEGLRLLARRKVYAGIRALRGKLVWDDSDEAWAKVAQERAAKQQAAKAAPQRAPKVAARTRTTA